MYDRSFYSVCAIELYCFLFFFSAQSSFSIDNPSPFHNVSKFNQGSIVSGISMLKFKSK